LEADRRGGCLGVFRALPDQRRRRRNKKRSDKDELYASLVLDTSK
jgi:hypothetical protein